MYGFNDRLDKAVSEPVAKSYRVVTNNPIRSGVTNFVYNLGEPVTFANEIFQGKIPDAAGAFSRFVINTTIGVVGIFDTAASLGIQRRHEDFGETLEVWGLKPGSYMVLPFLVSTTPRDLFGKGGDIGLSPLNSLCRRTPKKRRTASCVSQAQADGEFHEDDCDLADFPGCGAGACGICRQKVGSLC